MAIAHAEDEHLRKGGEMKLPPDLKAKEKEMNDELVAEAKALQEELDKQFAQLQGNQYSIYIVLWQFVCLFVS